MRLLELKLNNKYHSGTIIESLKKYSCSNLEHDFYLFDYYDEIIKSIENVFNVDLSHKYLNLKEIRKILK